MVQWPTEFNDFTVPGDFEIVEIKDYGVNLPPLEGVPNKYERIQDPSIKVYKMETDLSNQPKDNELPTKNIKLPFA